MTTDEEQSPHVDVVVSRVFEPFALAVAEDPDKADRIRRIGRALAEAAQRATVSSASAAGASAGQETGRESS